MIVIAEKILDKALGTWLNIINPIVKHIIEILDLNQSEQTTSSINLLVTFVALYFLYKNISPEKAKGLLNFSIAFLAIILIGRLL